jgi:signal recognition particle receptor subunit beta
MQMAAKIVYYGPGLCGKTSNLSFIYARTAPNSRGEMVSLETESDRTLFFDLLPIEVGTIGGFKTRLQLYTVPGQVFYNTTRKLVLKGVDGLVFVADSQRPMREANIESLDSLVQNLEELGIELADLPLVMQYNKRDLKNILSVEELNADLNPDRAYSFFESEAINGAGVFESLKEITKLTLKKLRKRMVAPHAAPAGPRTSATQVSATPSPASKPTAVSAAALARAAAEGVDGGGDDREPTPVQMTDPPPVHGTEAMEASAEASPFAEDQIDDDSTETVSGDFSTDQEVPDGEGIGGPDAAAELTSPFDGDQPTDVTAAEAIAEPEFALDEESPQSIDVIDDVPEMDVEFDQTDAEPAEGDPPPLKRVQVSNQMDILAELEGLRKQATMGSFGRGSGTGQDLDIDALLADADDTRELRRKVEHALNSDVFRNMCGLELAIIVQNADGDAIHTLDPVSVQVEKADRLKKLYLRFTVDLENHQ